MITAPRTSARPKSKRTRNSVWKNDRRIRLAMLLFAAVVFMASFRAPNARDVMLDYQVTGWIASVQQVSLYVVAAFMVLIIILVPRKHKLLLKPSFPKPLLYFGMFQLVLILTTYQYDKKGDALLISLVFLVVTLLLFGKVLRRFAFDLFSPTSLLPYFYGGLIAFLAANLLIEYGGLGNTTWKGRFQGVTGHPNFLGMIAAIGIVCSVAYVLSVRKMKTKMIYMGLLVLSVTTCVLTFSRSGMVAAVAGVAIIVNCYITKVSTRIVTILASAMLFVFILTNVGLETLDYSGRGNTREGTWKSLVAVIDEVPILGADPGKLPTSNSYLFAFAASGLVGFLFFVLAILKPFRKMWIISFKLTLVPAERINYSLTAGLTALLLTGAVFEGMLLDAISAQIVTFFLVLSFSNVRVARIKKARQSFATTPIPA